MSRSRSVLLGLLMVVVTTLTTTTPAHANHAWIWGHWYAEWSGETPAPPIWDRNNTYRTGISSHGDDYIFRHAAHRWRYNSEYAIRPWLQYIGGDPWDCSPRDWMIVVCLGHPGTDSAGRPALGSMQPTYHDNQLHFRGAVIRLNPWHDWSSTNQLANVGTHELGHALGLGHYFCDCRSVMDPDQGNSTGIRWPDDHDKHSMWDMYLNHAH
jgi:hypothetical protein